MISTNKKFKNEIIPQSQETLRSGGNSFSEGAEWIIKYLGDNTVDFSGKTLKFEEVIKAGENKRRIDVVDNTIETSKVFYEFKSVKEVPPGHFAEQFMKDLTNANGLDQIKWLFDGRKAPENFEENMLKAIDQLPINQRLIDKFQVENVDELRDLIESQFNNLFKLIE